MEPRGDYPSNGLIRNTTTSVARLLDFSDSPIGGHVAGFHTPLYILSTIFKISNCDVNFPHRVLDDKNQSRTAALKSQLKLVVCTTDGASSMPGRKPGFQASLKLCHQMPLLLTFYTDSMVMPLELLPRSNEIVKIVNFIKASALNTRLFPRLCEDLRSDCKYLFHHKEMRWLSPGNSIMTQLRQELLVFFREKILKRIRRVKNFF